MKRLCNHDRDLVEVEAPGVIACVDCVAEEEGMSADEVRASADDGQHGIRWYDADADQVSYES